MAPFPLNFKSNDTVFIDWGVELWGYLNKPNEMDNLEYVSSKPRGGGIIVNGPRIFPPRPAATPPGERPTPACGHPSRGATHPGLRPPLQGSDPPRPAATPPGEGIVVTGFG